MWLVELLRSEWLYVDADVHWLGWGSWNWCAIQVLFDELDGARAVRGLHEVLDPYRIEFGRVGGIEDEAKWRGRLEPERAVASWLLRRVFPGEGEALTATQLDDDGNFQVCKGAIFDPDRCL